MVNDVSAVSSWYIHLLDLNGMKQQVLYLIDLYSYEGHIPTIPHLFYCIAMVKGQPLLIIICYHEPI